MMMIHFRPLYLIIVLFLFSCNKLARKSVAETLEVSSHVLTKTKALKGVTNVTRNNLINGLGKQLVQKVPSGKSSLEVVELSKGKWVPKFNNLGQSSSNYTSAVNQTLLKERRKHISPYLQFPTIKNLENIDVQKLTLGRLPHGAVLEKNMLAVMDINAFKLSNAFGGKEAHHVVEGTDKFAEASRGILKKFDIDINHPINGIFLPQNKNSIYKGTLHKTSHTKEYSLFVYDRIKDVKNKDELIKELTRIKYDLYEGKMTLEGGLHAINKNGINL